MDYIIFDLEWNQSMPSKEEEKNKDLPIEIVEIGAVKLNSNREMISEFSELIKPQVYRELNSITKRLIHIQMEELEKGKPFVEVMERFLEWCGDDYIFCTWGNLDLLELQRNMKFYNMETLSNGPIKFYDIQKLFSVAYEDGKSRRTLEYAIDMMGVKKDIPFHRAFSDAYYTARIFDMIEDPDVMELYSYDAYCIPQSRDDEIYVVFKDYAKQITRGFLTKAEIFEDKETTSIYCYHCDRKLRKKIKWFSLNKKIYHALAKCPKHGYVKSKLRVRKTEDGLFYGVKTDKCVSAEDAALVHDKLEKFKLAKKEKKINHSI